MYRLGEIIDVIAQGDERELTQRRIIYITTKRVVVPSVVDKHGNTITRYYTFENICELVLAVDLMRASIATEAIAKILDKYRSCKDRTFTVYTFFTELKIDKARIAARVEKYLNGEDV